MLRVKEVGDRISENNCSCKRFILHKMICDTKKIISWTIRFREKREVYIN